MTTVCFGLLVMFCQSIAEPKAIDSYCKIAKPIYWHKTDTRYTKEQVDTHNRQWKALCNSNVHK